MIETKWTRGPWSVGKPDPRRAGQYYVFNRNGDAELGDFYVAGVQWEGDANLIVAAPDLYEALKAYEQWEASLILEGDWSDGLPKMTPEQFDDLFELQVIRNSALDKAKGKL